MLKKGPREIGFIGFVGLIGFIGLRKQACVESYMPLAEGNSTNTTNPIDTKSKKNPRAQVKYLNGLFRKLKI